MTVSNDILLAQCPFCGERVSCLVTPETLPDDGAKNLACTSTECTEKKYQYVEIGTAVDDSPTWLDAPVAGPVIPEPVRRKSPKQPVHPRLAR